MSKRFHKHKRVRFSKRDIAPLHNLPSAAGQDLHPVAGREPPHWSRRAVIGSVVFASVLVVLFAIGFAVLRFGLGGDELTSRARIALQNAAGDQWKTDLKSARITLDSQHFLTVEASGVTIINRESGKSIGSVGAMRFGLAPLALIRGTVKIATISVDGLHLSAGDLPLHDKGPAPNFFDRDGLVDTRIIYQAVFANAGRTFDLFSNQATRSISISNTRIDMPNANWVSSLLIDHLTIERGPRGRMLLAGKIETDGRAVSIEGFLGRTKDRALNLSLSASGLAIRLPRLETDKQKGELLFTRNGSASVTVTGTDHAGSGDGDDVLRAEIAITQNPRASDKYSLLSGTFEIVPDDRKFEIAQAKFVMGKTVLDFNGAVEPAPAGGSNKAPHYRYNAVSTTAVFAPADSPETALPAGIKVAGTIDKAFRRFNGDELALRTTDGEMIGQFSVVRANKTAPAVFLALHVPKMPLGQVKQLWPAFSAPGARKWVMSNVFGGMVTDSNIDMSVGPGRFGSGIALNSDEITGHFVVDNTRFDIVGDIPPVRDANGIVDFSGTDANITLKSGTAYLPSDRTVSASNGILKIHEANKPPVVGDLSIDISGSADAVAELSDFDPIAALRYVDIKPEELSGDVSGHVNAEIPMSIERPDRKLGWSADLTYSNLAISKPVDGQDITNAKGELKLKPGLAIFKADADLNQIPAHLNLVEPFGNDVDASERKRDITLTLDDMTRAKVAPGLNTILAGPVTLKVAGQENSGRKLVADLTGAKLTLPWVGWSKGAGIPAKAAFVLENTENGLKFKDFDFSGATFGAKGSIEVADGALSKINFPKLALNRGDDFSLSLAHGTSGYKIAIKGSQADLRPVVKKYRKLASAEPDISGQPVQLVADIATVTGFNDKAYEGFHMELATGNGKLQKLKAAFTSNPEIQSAFAFETASGGRTLNFNSPDLGRLLNFLGSYEHMEGGQLAGSLKSVGEGPLRGDVDVRDFSLVDEPRLKSMTAAEGVAMVNDKFVNSLPPNFDASRIAFDRGYAAVESGKGYLKVERGIVRGPVIGATFDGMIYGTDGQMALSGTFIPAYGINSALSQIPVLGYVLGNGRDRGLIGLTYKLTGDPAAPEVHTNPLSVIAPGIFRSIFEFR